MKRQAQAQALGSTVHKSTNLCSRPRGATKFSNEAVPEYGAASPIENVARRCISSNRPKIHANKLVRQCGKSEHLLLLLQSGVQI